MLHYNYTHTRTEATTGYFSCEPHPLPPLDAALLLLAERPLDEFMRRHILDRMTAAPAGQAAGIIRQTFAGAIPPAIEALVQELALLVPAWATEDPLFAPDAHFSGDEPGKEATPLVPLRWRRLPDREAHAEWNRHFAANIQQHRALPRPGAPDLPPLYPDIENSLWPGSGQDVPARAIAGGPADAGSLTGMPGLSPAFTAPFPAHIRAVHAGHAAIQPADAVPHTRPPAEETAALAEERLTAAGIIAGPQMRHTASLSPVALLRPWNVRAGVRQGRHHHVLEGQATTYGRGLSLADARASCLMEMVERASAYLSLSEDGIQGLTSPAHLFFGTRTSLAAGHGRALDPNDYPLEAPYRDSPLTWMAGQSPLAAETDTAGKGKTPREERVYVPVQMVSLFCNLDEIALFAAAGSTGIATGNTVEEARLAALLEILERDAEATTPFTKAGCFTLRAEPDLDPVMAGLLADYAARGINVQFQDLTGPMGVPVYKCFVMSPKGAIARGYGAGLSARRAVVSALTETPFPYPDGGPSGPLLRKLPVRNLHELPDYSLSTPARSLAMLEDLLRRNHRPPVYADLTRADLGFPVVRAFIPGLELTADNDAFSRVPLRLYANYLRMLREM